MVGLEGTRTSGAGGSVAEIGGRSVGAALIVRAAVFEASRCSSSFLAGLTELGRSLFGNSPQNAFIHEGAGGSLGASEMEDDVDEA